jgi:hypothetical protein
MGSKRETTFGGILTPALSQREGEARADFGHFCNGRIADRLTIVLFLPIQWGKGEIPPKF